MTVVNQLYDLLAVDRDIERHQQKLESIESKLRDDRYLLETRQATEEARLAFRSCEVERRDLDLATESAREKTSQLESRLYGGSVRNPRELEDMQLEFDVLRGLQSQQEEDLLRVMEASEEAESKLKGFEETLEEAEAKWKIDNRLLIKEREVLQTDLAGLNARRQELSSLVDSGYLGLYNRIRNTRQGQAVVKVERGMCQGCRITLPTRVVQQARTSLALVQCPSCSRILYVV